VAKKRKTLMQLKKEAMSKKQDSEWESLCKRCGACCHVKVGLSDGSYVVHPFIFCKHLTDNNLCVVYDRRFAVNEAKICFSREEMISRDYILAEGCPYAKLRPGYKTAQLVTPEEFDIIIERELQLGNYNILLANRVF
jgi:uncharacterized cysteine cluster protein YcgN (CxxCxxCC family)